MLRVALVFAGVMLVSCGSDKADKAGGSGSATDPLLQKMIEFKDSMCECKDKACVDKVEGRMLEWMMKNAEKFRHEQPTKELDEQADRIQEEMEQCKAKAVGGD